MLLHSRTLLRSHSHSNLPHLFFGVCMKRCDVSIVLKTIQDYDVKFVIELIAKMKQKPFSIEKSDKYVIVKDSISYKVEFERVSDVNKFMKFLKYELIPERRNTISLSLVNFLLETRPKVSVIPP